MDVMVPTVDRDVLTGAVLSMASDGSTPSIRSAAGRSSLSRNCLAYGLNVSTYLRYPSACRTSNARLDLPAPATPVTAVTAPTGTRTPTPFRLFCLAPSTRMNRPSMVGEIGRAHV